MTKNYDSAVELLRKWVRSTRADGLGPLGTNLVELEEIADMVEAELEAKREGVVFFEAECVRLRKVLADIDRTHMMLPVDADGVPIRPGDKVFGYGRKNDGMTVRFLDQYGNLMVCDKGSKSLKDCLYWAADNVTHSAPETVESLLAEMVKDIASERVIYVPDDKMDEFDARLRDIRADYAERIRKAMDNGD